MKREKSAIWWIRRDLRLHDNQALNAAVARGGAVIPLFILDPEVLHSRYHRRADRRRDFLFGGLRALDADLRARGSRLVVREGRPVGVLSRLVEESGADAIFAEADYSPYARRRDAGVMEHLPLHLAGGVLVHQPGSIVKAGGRPYVVFTPFSRAWRARPFPAASRVLRAPGRLSAFPALPSAAIPEHAAPGLFPPGEAEAHRRLEAFMRGPIFEYATARDRMDRDGTSALSPYLRFGMLSAREAAVAAQCAASGASPGTDARQGVDSWIGELIWRDFYSHVLFHFPGVLDAAFRASLRGIAWREDPPRLRAWQQGLTGYPAVDAGMRQLSETGWMHNRARMIVASFLVKDLLISWREGELWFMRQLVDGDPAANNGGWQWVAGTGTDAAPYFRIFNPVLQSRKCDPSGAYIRRWVPELARVPARYVHEPWLMPDEVGRESGCVIGRDYPAPVVDRAMARARALSAYRR